MGLVIFMFMIVIGLAIIITLSSERGTKQVSCIRNHNHTGPFISIEGLDMVGRDQWKKSMDVKTLYACQKCYPSIKKQWDAFNASTQEEETS